MNTALETAMNSSSEYQNESFTAFSITAEQSRQLDEEYTINDILVYLQKARRRVGGNTTIDEAYEILKKQTRFADEVEKIIHQQNTTATLAALEADKI
jgi:hypothetical protein